MTSLPERLTAVIAPHHCFVCGIENNILCDMCAQDLLDEGRSVCFLCQSPTTDSAVCKQCRGVTPLTHVWASASYDGKIVELIKAFKFERAKAAAEPLGKVIANTLPYLPEETIIVPAPTVAQRVRQRGYDQAVLLAKALGRETGFEVRTLLSRLGSQRQVGSSKRQRLLQAESSFLYIGDKSSLDHPLLLVDDVLTTGATLNAAAKVLSQHGANTIHAAVIAHST